MYLKTLTDAGVLESINSTLRFNKKYLPSVVGNSIELTIVIDAN